MIICVCQSTELNVRSSSWGIVHFNTGVDFIFSSVIGFFIAEVHCALASLLRVKLRKVLIELFLFLSFFFFESFLFLFIFLLVLTAQYNVALVAVFSN